MLSGNNGRPTKILSGFHDIFAFVALYGSFDIKMVFR